MTIDAVRYLNSKAINGLNLYAYCGNNPTMAVDPNGTEWWNPFTWDWESIGRVVGGAAMAVAGVAIMAKTLIAAVLIPGAGFATQIGFSTMMYGGFMIGSVFNDTIEKNMNAIGWNPFNTDAELVVESEMVSFYKGVPVIRLNLPSSCSFLGIFLDTDSYVDDITVKHEFGHNVQHMLLGHKKYLLGIAAPSVSTNIVHIAEALLTGTFDTFISSIYYDLPWERTADYFGGVAETERSHKSESLKWSLFYLLLVSAI